MSTSAWAFEQMKNGQVVASATVMAQGKKSYVNLTGNPLFFIIMDGEIVDEDGWVVVDNGNKDLFVKKFADITDWVIYNG